MRALLLATLLLLLPAADAAAASPPFAGVNWSGAELNPASANRINYDYLYPGPEVLARLAADGFNTVRLPVLWERLQPKLDGGLDEAELQRLRDVVSAAGSRGMLVVVDVHGYGRYRGHDIGSAEVPVAAFARFWGLLAARFANQPAAAFGLMNEPSGLSPVRWTTAGLAALAAVRATGARNLVLVPGGGWDGAHDFVSGGPDGSNAAALAGLHDPANNAVVEVHQYFDGNFSGTSAACRSPDNSVDTLRAFTDWARSTGHRAFLGEFGTGPSPDCLRSLTAVLRFLNANRDVWVGWTYWAAGPWWGNDYPFSVEPRDRADRPQMTVLKAALKDMAGPAAKGPARAATGGAPP